MNLCNLKKGIIVMEQSMLTTTDNPFDPFTQNDEWRAYDESKGHYTNCYLARVANWSPDLSPIDESIAIETAIDEIVKENVNGLYRKVTMDSAA
jgi:hypothetical protein